MTKKTLMWTQMHTKPINMFIKLLLLLFGIRESNSHPFGTEQIDICSIASHFAHRSHKNCFWPSHRSGLALVRYLKLQGGDAKGRATR